MEPRHIPALRLTLRSMLADVTYGGAWKSAPWVEARLGEAGWSEQVCLHLKVLALRWVSTQRDDVRAAMRKALGEELNAEEEAMLPSQARLSSTQHALTTSLEGDAMATIAELTTQDNGTIVVPKDSTVSELYGELDWTELERQARLMRSAPWDEPQERLEKAVGAIKAGYVSLGVPAISLAFVRSEDGQRKYTVRDTGCTCRATRPCYHLTAAELYRLWQDKISTPSLFPAPKTIDERLAETPQDRPGATISPQDDSTGAPADVVPLVGDADTQQEVSRMATVPVNDLERPAPTVVPLPPLTLPLRSITAIIADLSRPLPQACIATKSQGGQTISYLHWQHVTRLLDAYAPGWHGTVTRIDKVGKACAITYRLTIPCLEGTVSREATGQEEEDLKGYGDPTSNAEAMALKRAAAKFGLGADLYDKDDGKDRTAQGIADYLKAQKAEALKELGQTLDATAHNRERTLAWLKTQTGATRNDAIPLAAIRALLAHLTAQASA